MQKFEGQDNKYFPAEESESKMYIFDEIIDCTTDKIDKVNKSTKYKILIGTDVFTVKCE